MVLQPAAYRSWSVFRALSPGLFCRCQGDPTPSFYCVSCTAWLPVRQRITWAVLTFKIRSTPAYLSRHITARDCRHTLLSSIQFPCCVFPSTGRIPVDVHFASTSPLLPPGTLCHAVWLLLRAKLHYTYTGYEHQQRTPPTDKLTTILQQICHIAMPEPNISTCQDVGMWQIFVRWWCSLVVFV